MGHISAQSFCHPRAQAVGAPITAEGTGQLPLPTTPVQLISQMGPGHRAGGWRCRA